MEIYNTDIYLSPANVKYYRKTYDLLDLLGDIGGVTEVVMITFGFMLLPISEHSFTLRAAKRLFLARTDDPEMFVYKPGDQKIVNYDKEFNSEEIKKELALHKNINISTSDSIKLFLANLLGNFFCCNRCFAKKRKF